MNTIEKKYTEALELPKILAMLSEECTGARAKSAAMNIQPSTDLFTVKREVAKASAALDMSSRYGTPMFYGLDGAAQAIGTHRHTQAADSDKLPVRLVRQVRGEAPGA